MRLSGVYKSHIPSRLRNGRYLGFGAIRASLAKIAQPPMAMKASAFICPCQFFVRIILDLQCCTFEIIGTQIYSKSVAFKAEQEEHSEWFYFWEFKFLRGRNITNQNLTCNKKAPDVQRAVNVDPGLSNTRWSNLTGLKVLTTWFELDRKNKSLFENSRTKISSTNYQLCKDCTNLCTWKEWNFRETIL